MKKSIAESKEIIDTIPLWIFIPSWIPFLSIKGKFILLRKNIIYIHENHEKYFYNYNRKIKLIESCYSMMMKIQVAESKASCNQDKLDPIILAYIRHDMKSQYISIFKSYTYLEKCLKKIEPQNFYKFIGSLSVQVDEIDNIIMLLGECNDQTRFQEHLKKITRACSHIHRDLYDLLSSLRE